MLIAQITDSHVTAAGILALGAVDTGAALARAVAQLNRLSPRPDVVVITGDVVNGPAQGEYERAAGILADLSLPYLMIPGNHDDRAGMRAAFPHAVPPVGEFLHQDRDLGPIRILALDTTIPGQVDGTLCDRRLDWIAERLAATDKPTLIVMHHHPFRSGIGFMDEIMCANADRLEGLLRGRNIIGVLCGHLHRAISVPFAGTVAFSCPSTGFQLALDLSPDGPGAWTDEPPAIALHHWTRADGLRSHLVPIGEYGVKRFG